MLTTLAEEKDILTLCGFEEGQTEANLSRKDLRPIDAKLIARELTTGFVSASITNLVLRHNEIGSEGAVALGKALEVNASIKNLNLRQCGIGKDGAVALAEALHVNASMNFLE